MFEVALAVPRRALNLAHRAVASVFVAVEAIPRIAAAMDELRAAIRNIERLATFASEELPEIVYQIEAIRSQLSTLDQRLAGTTKPTPSSRQITPKSPRIG